MIPPRRAFLLQRRAAPADEPVPPAGGASRHRPGRRRVMVSVPPRLNRRGGHYLIPIDPDAALDPDWVEDTERRFALPTRWLADRIAELVAEGALPPPEGGAS